MHAVDEGPLYTEQFATLDEFRPAQDSAYISGTSVEDRSTHSKQWEQDAKDVSFWSISSQEFDRVGIGTGHGGVEEVVLRSIKALLDFWSRVVESVIYLDYTGLSHHVWAPLLRSALAAGKTVRAVYIEPGEYRRSDTPREGEIFDLSEKISGVAPIPGFASLDPDTVDSVFVPLLGFEGSRFAHLVEVVQPVGERIVPVIGVPGFRPEYPFHTYLGNQPTLEDTKAWRHVRFARANCPFSALHTLSTIEAEHPNTGIKVAPIGTKPHALGAVLFYLTSSRPIELIYDHPIRKDKRTAGSGRVNVYHVSSLRIEPSRAVGRARR